MIASLALTSSLAAPPAIQVDYEQFAGLQIRVNGIPLVQGSSFQYYEEGWKRGIYSSNWRPKQIERLPNSTLKVKFEGDDGNVVGFQTYEKTSSGVKCVQEFRWRGARPVRIENCLGLLWAPALEKGELTVDGQAGHEMDHPFRGSLPIAEKMLGPSGSRFVIRTPFVDMTARVSPGDAVLFDARGHDQEWAENRELFWLGSLGALVSPGKTTRFEIEWSFDVKSPATPPPSEPAALEGRPLTAAVRPYASPLPLIPAPKKRTVSAQTVELGRTLRFEAEPRHIPFEEEFERELWRRWDRSTLPAGPVSTVISARVAPLGLPREGYRIEVSASRISLTGQDEEGLHNAFRTLAWLAQARSGRLVVPFQEITDWPSLAFRGIHMFVGPTALSFQSKLMEACLSPLKINRVVLQCERTNWKCLPGIETPITMKREDLRELFARYRALGIEPIPLIQSLGHTYWIFANGKNLDIAINPDEAFTLDPRRDRSRQVLDDLWTEAVDLLHPKTIHFGLDEIDMRGIPEDPSFTTRLWTRHVPWLLDLAARKKAVPMMWGDIMLGPGEGTDALNAKSAEAAQARRRVLRPGVMIADWHYADNPQPEAYRSLEVWKAAGVQPVASTWHKPNNIRGFALAAVKAGAPGLLQTTWAGYESSEAAMISEFDQFSAYVLAADYAWSGRPEMPDRLPYRPSDVMTRLYFAPPEPVVPTPGGTLGSSALATRIGPVSFRLFDPIPLHTPVSAEGLAAPGQISFRVGFQAKEVALAVDAAAWVAGGEPLAEVEIVCDTGSVVEKLLYGRHARAPRDPRASLLAPRSGGLSAVRIPLSADGRMRRVKEIRLKALSPAGGLRLHGITWVSE